MVAIVVTIVGTVRAMPCIQLRGSIPLPSTSNRIQGDLDVRVPRRSARARASVRRWPWSSRRGPGAALTAIDLSVVRGVGSSKVVRGSAGSYRPVIAGAKLREGTTTILPREGERSRESACLQCGFTPLAGDTRTMKTDTKGALRLQPHLLLDRPEIDWPCRTRISCHHLVWAAH